MIKRRDLGARAARARIGSGGGGGTPKWLGLLALVVLAAIWLGVPAGAQDPCSPAPTLGSVIFDEDEILGSFAVRSTFVLRPKFLDTNGDPIYCAFHLEWNTEPVHEVITDHIDLINVTRGGSFKGFYVARRGEATVNLKVLSRARVELHTESITLQVGEPPTTRPPEPHTILMTSPLSQRRAQNEFTINALVLDANGATVPDGTPIEWTAVGFLEVNNNLNLPEPDVRHWIPASVDRTTTNGAASATFRRAGRDDTTDLVIVTARAGEADGSLMTEANRAPHQPPNANEMVLDGPSRWSLFEIGDAIPLTATVTQSNGSPVADGKYVHWRWHEEGVAIAYDRPDVLVFLPTGRAPGTGDTQTTSGVAQATHTARFPGKVIVRAYNIDNEPWVLDAITFNVGEYHQPPADLALRLRLLNDSDDIVPIGSTLRVGAELTYSEIDQALHVTEGTLRILGSLEWEAGRSRLDVPAQSALSRGLILREHMVGLFGQLGQGAEDGAAEGQCKGVSDEGETAWTCTLDVGDSSIEILPGTPPGVYTISGVLSVNGREYHDTLEVTVVGEGSIDEVAEVSFDFAPQERGANRGEPYPSTIAVGESTELRLTALNEHGAASAAGSISAILLTTTTGSLSTSLGDGCADGDGISCRVPVSAVSASNADQIPIRLTHPGAGQAGITTVRARVISADGEVFSPPPLSVTFKGAADSLAISKPATGLLGLATGGDDRDLLKLTVTATDADGNDVDVPYRAPRAVIRGPDGKQVSSGLSVVWTEDGPDDDEVHDRFARNAANAVEATIRATAAAEAPLATGEYTLELRTSGKSATRTFSIVGAVDSVTLGEPQGVLQAGGIVSLSATVRDAGGTLAPDGTRVEWTRRAAGDSAVLVQLSAEQVTTDGTAAAEFLAVSAGTAIVTVEADGVGDVRLVAIAEAPPAVAADAPPPRLIDNLTNIVAGGFSAWFGDEATTASALFNELTGVGAVMLWQNGAWLSYSGAGSVDFTINPGVVLWLER